jgi:hypothetical protein
MLKLKHLRHPFRTAAVAGAKLRNHFNIHRSAARSQRYYGDDNRYDLENVDRGLAPRRHESSIRDSREDTTLLERICSAYGKAVEQQRFEPERYEATGWWNEVRSRSLGPVMHALQTGDIDSLRRIYRNFFRNPCSSGLVDLPYGLEKVYFGGKINDLHRRFYLGDALHRIDYWTERTGNRFSLRDLAGPNIGNPFGVSIDGTLVRTGAPYQHYCAQRIASHLATGPAVVAEIGGGFGGMAYYLLRDRPKLTYLDFDLPESIALTAYYLMESFPHLNFLLYGEEELTGEAMQRADVVLMPLFELPKLPLRSVDVSFSSNAISDLSRESIVGYLEMVAWCTRNCFLHIGASEAAPLLSESIGSNRLPFRLAETLSSGWHKYKYANAAEVECLYCIGAS